MPRTQAERREVTQSALLAAARKLFGERGFAGVPIEEIASEAGVTRGALYHHFKSKEALFAMVFERVEQELIMHAAGVAGQEPDPWSQLRNGCRAFLEAVSEPPMARIVLQDAPAVLGWQKWREVDLKYSLALVTNALKMAMDAGQMRVRTPEPAAHLLLGALNEAAMMIGSGERSEEEREEVLAQFDSLLEGMR